MAGAYRYGSPWAGVSNYTRRQNRTVDFSPTSRDRAGLPQRGDDVAAPLVRGDQTLLRDIRRRHAAADRQAAELGAAEPPL